MHETAILLHTSNKGKKGTREGKKGTREGKKGAKEGKKGAREGKKGAAPFYFGLAGTLGYETSQADSPWVKDVPYWFQGQKFIGQGHSALI